MGNCAANEVFKFALIDFVILVKINRSPSSAFKASVEELVLGDGPQNEFKRMQENISHDFRCANLANKIEFIYDFIFSEEKEAEAIWKKAFPNSR